jgi:signal recognition particle receptor subunit beta
LIDLGTKLFMELWIIILTATIGLLGIFLTTFLLVNRSKRDKEVILLGLADSGKSALFYHLVANKALPTFTSQVHNEQRLQIGEKSVNLVDMPGHPRLRTELMHRLKTVTAIIFVIDAGTVLPKITDIANLLYDILSRNEVLLKKLPVFIVASKSDLPGSRQPELIRSRLQEEMGYIRDNRKKSNYVEDGDSQLFLGREDQEFDFEHLTHEVTFGSCSVNAGNTAQVREFLERIAKK